LSYVMAHPLAAMVSTVRALDAAQLPAAMSYGPLAALAWAIVQLLRAVHSRLRMIAR
jgi:hypothetical protein